MTGGGANILLVPEQAADLGGSERVLEALLRRYPEAQAIALNFRSTTVPEAMRPEWDRRVRRVGPDLGIRRPGRLPLYARRIARVPTQRADLVVSITQPGWSLAVAVPEGARHLAICPGVPRALFGNTRDYLREVRPLERALAAASVPAQRRLWRRLLRRPDRLITMSRYSATELEAKGGRGGEVIYPPVRTAFFTPAAVPRRHFLLVARLVEQKRVGAVLAAFSGLEERLVVVGEGTASPRLRAQAGPEVTFTGRVSDEDLRSLLRRGHALICPSMEEFGIVMAEAHACGTPVIATNAGGAREIVEHGRTGLLLDSVHPRSLRQAVLEVRARAFDREGCRRSAERFSEDVFFSAVDRVVHEELEVSTR